MFCYKPRLSNALLEEFGSFTPLFEMSQGQLEERFGRRHDFFVKLCDKRTILQAEQEIQWAASEGIKIVPLSSVRYPARLRQCADPPALLYIKGELDEGCRGMVSIVGTRLPTKYGIECCRMIITDLKEQGYNPIIVSGLAYGIDITAHKAALENGLSTIAVLPNGLDKIYPVAHHSIASVISGQGALITEFPRHTESLKVNFIQRNRVIAALSEATLVIESKERGGALITAGLAHSYSRDVFALPGRISDICSQGCNNLISKNIANIFTTVASFAETLGWSSKKEPGVIQGKLFVSGDSNKEKIVLALNDESELTKDELLRRCGISLPQLSSLLLGMELEGTIISLPGERYCILKH